MQSDMVSIEAKVNRELDAVSTRDYQLWAIGMLVMLVLLTGVFAVVAPSALWKQAELRVDTRYVPQLLLGLTALVLLLNFYLVDQKRKLRHIQDRLVGELLQSNRLQQFSLLDRETGVFSKQYLPEVVARESANANRFGTAITFIGVEASCGSQDSMNPDGNKDLPVSVAHILRSNFRGTDNIIRMQDSTFLIALPETNEHEASIALRRLASRVDDWNANPQQSLEIHLQYQTASYQPEGDMWTTIEEAQRSPKHPIACMLDGTDIAAGQMLTQHQQRREPGQGAASRREITQ